MNRIVILDSGPLGLLMQRPGVVPADECRRWLAEMIAGGGEVIVPEIADYEVRRELLRINAVASVLRMDSFLAAAPGRLLPVTTQAMRLAAELWANIRCRGKPTSDPHALDEDVLIVAQVLTAGFDENEFIIASTNVVHLSQLAPSALWRDIQPNN